MDRLARLKNNQFYARILDIIYDKIGVNKFEIIDNNENLIAFRFNSPDNYSFDIVFWLNENRISFNIEDWYEIIDSYLADDKEASEVFDFIDTIFKNEVLIEEYKGRTNKIFKKNLVFVTKVNDRIQKISNVKTLHFKLPWVKTELGKVNEFKALY
ncbi:MAG: hypothetical protein KGZ87_00520 [Bacteroidetes bacterium]|nr:hypothetical protein [Bacteroidota bacterium]